MYSTVCHESQVHRCTDKVVIMCCAWRFEVTVDGSEFFPRELKPKPTTTTTTTRPVRRLGFQVLNASGAAVRMTFDAVPLRRYRFR